MPTAKVEDAELVPFSFQWSEKDFASVVTLNLWWNCKIMLSGLCQTLYTCGAPIRWPSLAELYEEERQCALFISMSVDYSASLAPYACMVTLMNMQTAWGVYWRQKDFLLSLDGYAMAEWLRRRGNEFMALFNGKEMHTFGLAFNMERHMGGPVLPEEFHPSKVEEHEVLSELRKVPELISDTSTKVESDSILREGMRNIMMQAKTQRETLFHSSLRNKLLDAEHLT